MQYGINNYETVFEDLLLDKINEAYQDAVDQHIKDLEAFTTAVNFTTDASDEAIRALKVANALLTDMLMDHEITELDWNGTFVPQYDWMSITLDKLNVITYNLFDIDDYYTDVSMFSNFLFELVKHEIVTDFVFYNDYFNFKLVGFDGDALNKFNDKYSTLRDTINYFKNYS